MAFPLWCSGMLRFQLFPEVSLWSFSDSNMKNYSWKTITGHIRSRTWRTTSRKLNSRWYFKVQLRKSQLKNHCQSCLWSNKYVCSSQKTELQESAMFICRPETHLPTYWLHFRQSRRALLYTDHWRYLQKQERFKSDSTLKNNVPSYCII